MLLPLQLSATEAVVKSEHFEVLALCDRGSPMSELYTLQQVLVKEDLLPQSVWVAEIWLLAG
jgi:hypothetical protein